MAGAAELKITGDDPAIIARRYEFLGGKALRAVMRKSVGAMAGEVRKEAKRRAKRYDITGHLRRSIGNKRVLFYAPFTFATFVGARTNFKATYTDGTRTVFRWATKYAHLVAIAHKLMERSGIASASKQAQAYKRKLRAELDKAVVKARAIR